jgi:hypothetical protein
LPAGVSFLPACEALGKPGDGIQSFIGRPGKKTGFSESPANQVAVGLIGVVGKMTGNIAGYAGMYIKDFHRCCRGEVQARNIDMPQPEIGPGAVVNHHRLIVVDDAPLGAS